MPSFYYTPGFNEVERGYTGFTLSVCPSVDRIVPALYLKQYFLDPFHICTSYQATSEGVSRVMFVPKLKNLIQNFDFVYFLLGIQFDSVVRVIMRRRGVSSEHRRSSCSSLNQCWITVYWTQGNKILWNFKHGTTVFVYFVLASMCYCANHAMPYSLLMNGLTLGHLIVPMRFCSHEWINL